MKSALETFDGLDNRKDLMNLLQRLGTDADRASFLQRTLLRSNSSFARMPMAINGGCDPVAAYFMLIAVCNELGVPISVAAKELEEEVRNL